MDCVSAVQRMAVKPVQRISSTDQKQLTGARLFCLALGLGQQSVKCHKHGLRIVRSVNVWKGYLYFSSTILIDAAIRIFKNVLFTNDIILSSEVCAARIYSRFLSVAGQVLETQYPITQIPVSLDLHRQLLEKMKSLFLLIAKLYNDGSCSVLHCWVHFFE